MTAELTQSPPDSQFRCEPPRDDAAARLACLLEVAGIINSSLELGVVLDHILQEATRILGAESGSVMLLEENGDALRVVAAHGPRCETVFGRRQALDEGVASWVVRHERPVLLHGAVFDGRFSRICERQDVHDALCVPLRTGDEVLGAISLNNRLRGMPFTQDDLELLIALSHHAALAIRNARAYDQIETQRATLARLLDEVTRAQEEERRRIALQMHDGPAQTLFAVLRNVEATRAAAESRPEALPALHEELERAVRCAIDETRGVMVDLRPLSLDDLGLYAALKSYAERFHKRTGIRARVVRHGRQERLPGRLESSFYRIVQEALTNVWKHAEASRATVVLEIQERTCAIEIRDDGKGFNPEAAAANEGDHLGMSSLRERAELIGGRLSVTSLTGKGSVVRVDAPL